MNPEERSKLKMKIQTEINKQKSLIGNLSESAKPIPPDNAIGRLTRMEAIGDKSISEASLNSARQRLTELEAALAKIDQSHFGLCVACQCQIPLDRIVLMPETSFCVSCAEKKLRKPFF